MGLLRFLPFDQSNFDMFIGIVSYSCWNLLVKKGFCSRPGAHVPGYLLPKVSDFLEKFVNWADCILLVNNTIFWWHEIFGHFDPHLLDWHRFCGFSKNYGSVRTFTATRKSYGKCRTYDFKGFFPGLGGGSLDIFGTKIKHLLACGGRKTPPDKFKSWRFL